MRIYFRTDASHTIGFGHLIRCISLAKYFQKLEQSVQISFVLKFPDTALELLRDTNFKIEIIPEGEDEFSFLQRYFFFNEKAVIVFDTLSDYPAELIKSLTKRHTTVMLHSYSLGRLFASLAIYPVGHLDDNVLIDFKENQSKTKVLTGMQYCLLNAEVFSLEPSRAFVFPPSVVSVVAGGSDPANTLGLVSKWLTNVDIEGCNFQILYGKASIFASKDTSKLEKNQVQFLPFSIEQIQKSDIVISAFGVTIYELVYLRKPVISYGHTQKHAEASERFSSRYRCTKNLGNIFELSQEKFIDQLTSLLKSRNELTQLFQNTFGLVDSNGTERVSKAIIETYYEEKRI